MPKKPFILFIEKLASTSYDIYCGQLQNCATWLIPEAGLERLIPFVPLGIWLYLLFYVYVPYTFMTASGSKLKVLSFSFIISACISGIVFMILPSKILYPEFKVHGISAYCLDFVKTYDTEKNCLPSMHGSLITLCTIANFDYSKQIRNFSLLFLSLLMYYSIIQVRRHLFIDLSGGVLLACSVWPLSVWALNRLTKPRLTRRQSPNKV